MQRGALSACTASHPPPRGPEITLQAPGPPPIPLGQEEEVNVKLFSLPQAWASPLHEALLVATWHPGVQQKLQRLGKGPELWTVHQSPWRREGRKRKWQWAPLPHPVHTLLSQKVQRCRKKVLGTAPPSSILQLLELLLSFRNNFLQSDLSLSLLLQIQSINPAEGVRNWDAKDSGHHSHPLPSPGKGEARDPGLGQRRGRVAEGSEHNCSLPISHK